MSDHSGSTHRPRLCHLRKWSHFQGYGFNLHAEKARNGQFIGKVDPDSPADAAGLREKDRIIEVNHVNISNENHQQVVKRIRNGIEIDGEIVTDEVILLVVDQETDDYYKKINKLISSDDDNILKYTTPYEEDFLNGQRSGISEENADDNHEHVRHDENDDAQEEQEEDEEEVRHSAHSETRHSSASHSPEPSPVMPTKQSKHKDYNEEEEEEEENDEEPPSTNGKYQRSQTPSQTDSLKTPTISEKSNHTDDRISSNSNSIHRQSSTSVSPSLADNKQPQQLPQAVQITPKTASMSSNNESNNHSRSQSINSTNSNAVDPFNNDKSECNKFFVDVDIANEVVEAKPKFTNSDVLSKEERHSSHVDHIFKYKAIEAVHKLYDNIEKQPVSDDGIGRKDVKHISSSLLSLKSNFSMKINKYISKATSRKTHIKNENKIPPRLDSSCDSPTNTYDKYDDDVFMDDVDSTCNSIASYHHNLKPNCNINNNNNHHHHHNNYYVPTPAEQTLNSIFQMSAAEFKNYLKNKPKAKPREAHVDIKQKFKIFQEM